MHACLVCVAYESVHAVVCVVYMYAVQFIRENTVWNGTAKVVVTCLFVPHNITGLWYEEKEK